MPTRISQKISFSSRYFYNNSKLNFSWRRFQIPTGIFPRQQISRQIHRFLPGFLLHVLKEPRLIQGFPREFLSGNISGVATGFLRKIMGFLLNYFPSFFLVFLSGFLPEIFPRVLTGISAKVFLKWNIFQRFSWYCLKNPSRDFSVLLLQFIKKLSIAYVKSFPYDIS